MKIRFSDARTGTTYETYGTFDLVGDQCYVVCQDGKVYTTHDFARLGAKVIHAAPHERALMKTWSPASIDPIERARTKSGGTVVFQSMEYTVTERTEHDILIVASRGLSTPTNAAANTGITLGCGNILKDRLGMIIDLSELTNWQDRIVHAGHLSGYPLGFSYANNHAFVCREGYEDYIRDQNIAATAALGYKPNYFTDMSDAIDFLHSLKRHES